MRFCGQHIQHRLNEYGERSGLTGRSSSDHWEPCPDLIDARRIGGIAYDLQERARGWQVTAAADFDRGDMAAYDAHKAMSGCYKHAADLLFEAIGEGAIKRLNGAQ